MKRFKSLSGWLLASLFYLLPPPAAVAYTVELTRDQVQAAVEQYFPVEHATSYAALTLYRPVILLEKTSDRIGLEFTLLADVPGVMTRKGRGAIDGDLEYRQETGEFYLHDPKVRRVEVDDCPPDIAASIEEIVRELTRQAFPVILVYKLKDDDIGQKMAKRILSSVTVSSGKLLVELTGPAKN